MTKTIEENFIDWEGSAFGYGYGSGEPHILPALKRLMELIPGDSAYDYEVLERGLSPTVAWLLINILCKADVLEYGTSPRCAWLTARGRDLRSFVMLKSDIELIDLATQFDMNHIHCYPDACNCGPDGYVKGKKCQNPFWK